MYVLAWKVLPEYLKLFYANPMYRYSSSVNFYMKAQLLRFWPKPCPSRKFPTMYRM